MNAQQKINLSSLVLRLGLGLLMVPHGYQKMMGFTMMQEKFLDFMGLGQNVSLSLAIFAEFFCSILLILGLFTRIVCIPLLILTTVIVFIAHGGDVVGEAGFGAVFFVGYFAILILGPGDFSIDRFIFKKK